MTGRRIALSVNLPGCMILAVGFIIATMKTGLTIWGK